MAEAVHELKEKLRAIESELRAVKNRLTAIELSEKNAEHAKAAEAWLALISKSKSKWSPEAPSSVEISRRGRRHARS